MPALPFPGLSKKMKDIHALRYINSVKLTRKEIESVLPPLRSLRNAEKAAQTQSEKALEEERLSLLEANSDDPEPINSMPSVQIELDRYHQAEQKTWREVEKTVGAQKATMLQMLVGRISAPGNEWSMPPRMLAPGALVAPSVAPPRTGSLGRPKGGAPKPPILAPSLPGSPGSPTPINPATPIAPPSAPSIEEPVKPQPPTPAGEVLEPQLATPQAEPVAEAQSPALATQSVDPALPAGQAQAAPTIPTPNGFAPFPAKGAQAFPQPGLGGGFTFGGFGGFPSHITLSELVDLLEQKLNAMKR